MVHCHTKNHLPVHSETYLSDFVLVVKPNDLALESFAKEGWSCRYDYAAVQDTPDDVAKPKSSLLALVGRVKIKVARAPG